MSAADDFRFPGQLVFYFEFWMSTVNKVGALGTTGVLQNYRRGNLTCEAVSCNVKEHNANNSRHRFHRRIPPFSGM